MSPILSSAQDISTTIHNRCMADAFILEFQLSAFWSTSGYTWQSSVERGGAQALYLCLPSPHPLLLKAKEPSTSRGGFSPPWQRAKMDCPSNDRLTSILCHTWRVREIKVVLLFKGQISTFKAVEEKERVGDKTLKDEKRGRGREKGGKGGGKEKKRGSFIFTQQQREERVWRKGGGLFALGISVQGWRNVGCVAPARGREQPVIYQQVSNCYFIPSRAACLYTWVCVGVCRCVCAWEGQITVLAYTHST